VKKRLIYLLLAVSFPAFVFLNVAQSVRYRALEQEVARLEREQQRLLEQNKQALATVALLTSPERIDKLAEEDLELLPLDRENRTQVYIDSSEAP